MTRKARCEEIWDALSATADGSATAAEAAAADAHLRHCRRCASDRRLIHQLTLALQKTPEPIPPHGLRESILRATVLRIGWRERAVQVLGSYRSRPSAHSLAFAGAAAILLLVVVINNGRSPEELNPATGSPIASRIRQDDPEPSSTTQATPLAERASRPRFQIASAASLERDRSRPAFPVPRVSESVAGPEINRAELSEPRIPNSPTHSPTPIDAPDSDRAVAASAGIDANPRIERSVLDPPPPLASSRDPLRVARAEERPSPAPSPNTTEMEASAGNNSPTTYTMEARGSIDPGAVASLADLKRTLQKDDEEESLPAGAFRMNDRREVRLAVHTSRF